MIKALHETDRRRVVELIAERGPMTANALVLALGKELPQAERDRGRTVYRNGVDAILHQLVARGVLTVRREMVPHVQRHTGARINHLSDVYRVALKQGARR